MKIIKIINKILLYRISIKKLKNCINLNKKFSLKNKKRINRKDNSRLYLCWFDNQIENDISWSNRICELHVPEDRAAIATAIRFLFSIIST